MGSDAQDVIGHQAAEDEEGEDLPDDTGHHEIVAGGLQGGAGVGGCGSTTPGSLEDEREEITEDEDPGVESWWNARELRTDFQDAVLKSEIDAGSNESWGDDQTADLNLKAIARVWVRVKHYTTDVT